MEVLGQGKTGARGPVKLGCSPLPPQFREGALLATGFRFCYKDDFHRVEVSIPKHFVGGTPLVNSGKLYGTARRSVPARSLLTREEKGRRLRHHASEFVRALGPAFRDYVRHRFSLDSGAEEAKLAEMAKGESILSGLHPVHKMLETFARGASIDPSDLMRQYQVFEQSCRSNGIELSLPDSVGGFLVRQLRNEVETIREYLRATGM